MADLWPQPIFPEGTPQLISQCDTICHVTDYALFAAVFLPPEGGRASRLFCVWHACLQPLLGNSKSLTQLIGFLAPLEDIVSCGVALALPIRPDRVSARPLKSFQYHEAALQQSLCSVTSVARAAALVAVQVPNQDRAQFFADADTNTRLNSQPLWKEILQLLAAYKPVARTVGAWLLAATVAATSAVAVRAYATHYSMHIDP